MRLSITRFTVEGLVAEVLRAFDKMNNVTVLSLSSGILLFDLCTSEQNCNVPPSSFPSSSGSSSSSSNSMDPIQRCALLFAMYQTSLECSDNGIEILNLGEDSFSFFPNHEADALIVLTFRSDFDEELRQRIAMSVSKLFANQGINSQSSPRASSIKQLKAEIKLYLHSLLLEKADKLSALLLPNGTEADRNLLCYYEKEDVIAKGSHGDKHDKNRDKADGVSDPTYASTNSKVKISANATNNPNRRGRFFTLSSMGNDANQGDKFTSPVAPTKATWVNTIRSILGLRSRPRSRGSSPKEVPNKDNKYNVNNVSTHVHHFFFSPNESAHFEQEKWKIDNEKINPNIIVNELVPESFSDETYGSDRIYLEDEVTVSLVSSFRGCHYLWMYSRHRDNSGAVSLASKKVDLVSISASELVSNIISMGQPSQSRSAVPTREICSNMQICSDLVHFLKSQFE